MSGRRELVHIRPNLSQNLFCRQSTDTGDGFQQLQVLFKRAHPLLDLFVQPDVSVPAENPKSSDTNRSVLTVAAETVSESEQVPAQSIIDPLRDLLNRLSIF